MIAAERIPAELRALRRWVLWRYAQVDGRTTKVPLRVDDPGRHASPTDAHTWAGFGDALRVVELAGPTVVGIGFVLAKGDGFVGADFDLCASAERGELHPEAERHIRRLCGYTEWSPSARGVRVIVRGQLRSDRHKTADVPWRELAHDGRAPGFEVYSEGRFLTITADTLRGGDALGIPNQAGLDEVVAALLPPRERASNGPRPAATEPLDLDDEELLARARKAKHGCDFDRLWQGDHASYGSRSEADLALASALAFWTGGDRPRMDRMFRRSGLMRDKWLRVDYREPTLDRALHRREFYEPPKPTTTAGGRSEAEKPEHALALTTAKAICAEPDPPTSDELLGPLLRRGDRLVVGAGTGEGKTTFGLALVRAVVLQADLLGWTGTGGRALVIDAEQGLKTVKRRLREAGLDQSEAVDYVRAPDGLALDSDERQRSELERVLRDGGYSLVLADPLYKLHVGDSNAEREAVDLMRHFDRWRAELGFALVLPLHLRKPPPGAKFSLNEFFGSTAYTRGAEVCLGLQRVSDGYSRLHFLKDRDGDLPIATSWGLLFDREAGYRRDPKDGEERQSCKDKVRDLLSDQPGLTVHELELRTGNGERTVRRALKDLDAEEQGRTAEGDIRYRLPGEHEQEELG